MRYLQVILSVHCDAHVVRGIGSVRGGPVRMSPTLL